MLTPEIDVNHHMPTTPAADAAYGRSFTQIAAGARVEPDDQLAIPTIRTQPRALPPASGIHRRLPGRP
jgi:hypothetical protein